MTGSEGQTIACCTRIVWIGRQNALFINNLRQIMTDKEKIDLLLYSLLLQLIVMLLKSA